MRNVSTKINTNDHTNPSEPSNLSEPLPPASVLSSLTSPVINQCIQTPTNCPHYTCLDNPPPHPDLYPQLSWIWWWEILDGKRVIPMLLGFWSTGGWWCYHLCIRELPQELLLNDAALSLIHDVRAAWQYHYEHCIKARTRIIQGASAA